MTNEQSGVPFHQPIIPAEVCWRFGRQLDLGLGNPGFRSDLDQAELSVWPSFATHYHHHQPSRATASSMEVALCLPEVLASVLSSLPIRERLGCSLVAGRWRKAAAAATTTITLRSESSDKHAKLHSWLARHGQHITRLDLSHKAPCVISSLQTSDQWPGYPKTDLPWEPLLACPQLISGWSASSCGQRRKGSLSRRQRLLRLRLTRSSRGTAASSSTTRAAAAAAPAPAAIGLAIGLKTLELQVGVVKISQPSPPSQASPCQSAWCHHSA